MQLVQCDIRETIPIRIKDKTLSCNHKILKDFMDSDVDCVRVDDYDHKNAHSCAESFRASIRRFYPGLIVIRQRRDKVYLIKGRMLWK